MDLNQELKQVFVKMQKSRGGKGVGWVDVNQELKLL